MGIPENRTPHTQPAAEQLQKREYAIKMTDEMMTPDGRTSTIKTIDEEEFVVSGGSCIGGRSENQDSCRTAFVSKSRTVILSICDGMGGANGGRVASEIAVDTIISLAVGHAQSGEPFSPQVLVQIITKANEMVYNKAVEEPSLRGMGTTATLVVIDPTAAYVAHVGDSRIYQIRKGRKVYRTWDHSKVFGMVEAGILNEEGARTSGFSNIITRALGLRPRVDVTADKIPYRAEDRFVVCSDGIWNRRPEPEMIRLFCRESSTVKEVKFLIKETDAEGLSNGGHHDNLTCIVADVFDDSKFQYSFWRRFCDWLRRSFMGRLFCSQKTPQYPEPK